MQNNQSHPPQKQKKKSRSFDWKVKIILVLIAAVALLLFFVLKPSALPAGTAGQISERQVEHLVKKLGNTIKLPEEDPVTAMITDATLIKEQQPFYRDAENGDYVVIFEEAALAILYRLEKDFIVNIGPIQRAPESSDQSNTLPVSQLEQSDSVRIEIRNGSKKNGAAGELAETLERLGDYEVLSATNAENSYNQSYVVVLNDTLSSEDIADIVSSANAELVDVLPEGEAQSQADIIVFIGN